MVPNSLLNQLR